MIDEIIQKNFRTTKSFYTDKSTIHSYDKIYDSIFKPYVDKEGSLLEIGVYGGGSLLLWQEYFNKMKIIGLDIQNIVPYTVFEMYNPDRVKYFLEDAYSDETINFLKRNNLDKYDIIIDDGPHTEESQLRFVDLYLRMVHKNGLLVIEDVLSFDTVGKIVDRVHSILEPEHESDYDITVYDKRGCAKKRYDDLLLVVSL